MVASGRAADPVNVSTSEVGPDSTASHITLSPSELQLLDNLYCQVHELSCSYNLSLKRATMARRKSQFPDKANWVPPSPFYSYSASFTRPLTRCSNAKAADKDC